MCFFIASALKKWPIWQPCLQPLQPGSTAGAMYFHETDYDDIISLDQRSPNTGTRAACGPRTVYVRPANAFCMPYITQSYKYIVLATQPLQVTHH